MDKNTEDLWLKWYEEVPSDPEVQSEDDSNISNAPSEHSEHHTDTEQSGEEESANEGQIIESSPPIAAREPCFLGKDGTVWLKHKPVFQRGKTKAQNIVTKLPGVKGAARNAKEIIDCWQLFFPLDVLGSIVKYTNQKLDQMRLSYARPRDCLATDLEEMMAFVGLLYLAGIKKGQHLNTHELWAQDGTAPDYFIATMSERRFHILIRALRFDDLRDRNERSKLDNLSPIRTLFDKFVEKCYTSYTPGLTVTIDEMLDPFRGRCRFRQYIANKPAKYGIKINALVDARTFYVHNMEVYAGKQPAGPFQAPNDAASIVKRLIKHIDKTGRNITADNYFTSIPLANDLYINHRLTLVGTLRKNKREIPLRLLSTEDRAIGSTMCAYGTDTNHCTLTSYIPKKGKNVLMISTFHDDDSIDPESTALKPEVITFYNLTKGGVDVADRMKSEYSVTRVSNRWPFSLFCTMMNIATINSQIIYKVNTNQITSRRSYIMSLVKKLTYPHLIRRASCTNLPLPLKQKILAIANVHAVARPEVQASEEKPRCGFCPKRKNRFTQHKCNNCKVPVCKEHTGSTTLICVTCADL